MKFFVDTADVAEIRELAGDRPQAVAKKRPTRRSSQTTAWPGG